MKQCQPGKQRITWLEIGRTKFHVKQNHPEIDPVAAQAKNSFAIRPVSGGNYV
jgi:hypothetical protein